MQLFIALFLVVGASRAGGAPLSFDAFKMAMDQEGCIASTPDGRLVLCVGELVGESDGGYQAILFHVDDPPSASMHGDWLVLKSESASIDNDAKKAFEDECIKVWARIKDLGLDTRFLERLTSGEVVAGKKTWDLGNQRRVIAGSAERGGGLLEVRDPDDLAQRPKKLRIKSVEDAQLEDFTSAWWHREAGLIIVLSRYALYGAGTGRPGLNVLRVRKPLPPNFTDAQRVAVAFSWLHALTAHDSQTIDTLTFDKFAYGNSAYESSLKEAGCKALASARKSDVRGIKEIFGCISKMESRMFTTSFWEDSTLGELETEAASGTSVPKPESDPKPGSELAGIEKKHLLHKATWYRLDDTSNAPPVDSYWVGLVDTPGGPRVAAFVTSR